MKELRPGKKLLPILSWWLLCSGIVAANPYVLGDARFTVVTPGCVRVEYQKDGHFVDSPSMFAVGRGELFEGSTVATNGDSHTIDTGRMKLFYTADDKPFSETNLHVEIRDGSRTIAWTPASKQTLNLGGTINTLDQVKGPVSLEEGILSGDGWYLLDDSTGHLLVDDWVAPRPAGSGTDWYLFGYGNDYASAFKSFTTIGGAVPMPRKAVLGSWYSRWWEYTTQDYKDIVTEYAENNFPLDIIVMDMEWHTGNWTGWSWNYKLLDDPPALLKWFHDQGLAVTLNVHPADGVVPAETMYRDFMNDLGEDPDSGKTVTYDAGNKKYMETHFRHTHHPREDEGVDFWWLDWQQYPEVKSIPGLLNLSWLNKLYFDNSMRTGRRGLQFSRWGNWGDHRHPIHFSGDADTGWAMLGFEVPFTSTAANEGAYFWSHDIGGHFGDRNEEPYTRWVQFASTTAAMRIHSGIIPYLDRRPWKWPDWGTESMRRSFHLRSELMPYVYSAVRETHETGLPLNRPMYVAYPGEADAYRAPQQYMFGSDLLVAPIASPGVGPGHIASQLVWFPAGEWRNYFTSELVKGPQWRLVSADINEFPLYVRAGAPIPTQPYSARPTTASLDKLVVKVWPGPDRVRQSFTLYEDDGISRKYEAGSFLKTVLSCERDGDRLEMLVEPGEGAFDGLVDKRSYELVVGGVEKPDRVTVDGKSAKVKWDEATRSATITVKPRKVTKPVKVVVEAKDTDPEYFNSQALQRRFAGILGREAEISSLDAAILQEAESGGELLPGLLALAGVGIVENGTHFPQVGTMHRLVRNQDAIVDTSATSVQWQRSIHPDVAPPEVTESQIGLTSGIVDLTRPTWAAADLEFMQSSVEARILEITLNGKPITLTKQLAQSNGMLRDWRVSPVYDFDRAKEISAQKYEPESLSIEQLSAPLKGWIDVQAGNNGIVDLAKARGGENRLAYATAIVNVTEDRAAILGFRSDDGIEVWLNGAKIHSKNALRGINHDWEEVSVHFKKGANVLLVKVSQADFGWEFIVAGRDDVKNP